MKKIIFLTLSLIALNLLGNVHRDDFNSAIENGNLNNADSILAVWAATAPDDAELFAARFNLLLNRAHRQHIVLSGDTGYHGEGFVLSDSTGKKAGSIYSESSWNDSLVDLAMKAIDEGIQSYPDRLDFRLDKASAAAMTERWPTEAITILEIIERNKENKSHWFVSDNEAVDIAETFVEEAVFDRLKDFFNTDSDAALEAVYTILDIVAETFPQNIKIINLCGGFRFLQKNADKALQLFEQASLLDPEDGLPLTNIAHIKYTQGDSIGAIKVLDRILDGKYDKESKSIANQMKKTISGIKEPMHKYTYFFSYLYDIARDCKSPHELMNVHFYNTEIPEYNNFTSPFSDAEVKAEAFEKEGYYPTVVWTFPMPEEMPMCRYIAFTPTADGYCTIYTLELSTFDFENLSERRWILGSRTDNGHSNFGGIDYPETAADFYDALLKKGFILKEE